MDRIKGLETGHVRVISFNTVLVCWFPDILRGFNENYPGIEIEVSSCEGPAEGIRRIYEGEADCGFLPTDQAENIDLFLIRKERRGTKYTEPLPGTEAEAGDVPATDGEPIGSDQ